MSFFSQMRGVRFVQTGCPLFQMGRASPQDWSSCLQIGGGCGHPCLLFEAQAYLPKLSPCARPAFPKRRTFHGCWDGFGSQSALCRYAWAVPSNFARVYLASLWHSDCSRHSFVGAVVTKCRAVIVFGGSCVQSAELPLALARF